MAPRGEASVGTATRRWFSPLRGTALTALPSVPPQRGQRERWGGGRQSTAQGGARRRRPRGGARRRRLRLPRRPPAADGRARGGRGCVRLRDAAPALPRGRTDVLRGPERRGAAPQVLRDQRQGALGARGLDED